MNRRSLLMLSFVLLSVYVDPSTCFRTWRCHAYKCAKEEVKSANDAVSIQECKARCLKHGGLWPKPTGSFALGNASSPINLFAITFDKGRHEYEPVGVLLSKVHEKFLKRIINLGGVAYPSAEGGLYKVQVEVEANTFFGIRHGLETLSQLFFYDDLRFVYKMMNNAYIEDRPVFTHRGIVLDTARSFISKENILKMLDVMAANKLNTFHWHITDSQSFPYVSVAYPELSKAGAYSSAEVYTQQDIKEIVEEGRALGIRIVPEFDAPAHVGEGWSALGSDLITCFKWQPWREYCVEPPCGQLDPTNYRVYEILGQIYKEYIDLFQSDLLHMGGDEVNINCWKSTPRIREWMTKNNYSSDESGFHSLWADYQYEVLQRLKNIKASPRPKPILWTSTLTQPDFIGKYLSPEDYIIQIWTLKTDPSIKTLVKNNFHIIFSNYDELYFDCGGPSWVGRPGQNWCSPYLGWQYVYHHSPFEILESQGIVVTDDIKKLVLGSEAAIWTEQIDDHNVNVRLWPRASALGERLWSNPVEDWTDAQFRMNQHRERLAKIAPVELLQPRWCYQNDGFCD